MVKINVYDDSYETIEKVCIENGIVTQELIDLLLEYLPEVKEGNGLE